MLDGLDFAHAGASVLTAFLASSVEFVEALTVVLAIGAIRGWRGALAGAAGGFLILLIIVIVLGPTLTKIPLASVQLVVGTLLLLFGLRWLRKSVLRAAGIIPLHDEAALFAKESAALRALEGGRAPAFDSVAVAGAFKIVMLEGIEVVFIVIAIGTGGPGLLLSAAAGAIAALVLVVSLGIVVHKPIANLPENLLKFTVGILLSAFGTFWAGEGIGAVWPDGDADVVALVIGYLLAALVCVHLARKTALAKPRGGVTWK